MSRPGRPPGEPEQLGLPIEPTSFLDAVARVIGDMAVSPRSIAASPHVDTPEALLWAHRWVEQCDAVIDVPAGLGGPSTFLNQVRVGPVTLVDADLRVAQASMAFTGLTAVHAHIDCLPFDASAFTGATSIAPLGHPAERAGLLPELGRVLGPGAHGALWTCVSNTTRPFDSSRVRLPTLSQLEAELYAAGFEIDSWVDASGFPADEEWSVIHRRIRDEVESTFGSLPPVGGPLAENDRIVAAIADGTLSSLVYRLVRRAS